MQCMPELVQPRLSAPALRVQAQKQVNVSVVGDQRPPLHHEPAGSVFAVSAVRGDKLARSRRWRRGAVPVLEAMAVLCSWRARTWTCPRNAVRA
jgi:hypothetical protein